MIFQDLNNITDVYNKSGLAIQRMYNQSGDIIWEKIKSAINTITNYGDICWFTRFGLNGDKICFNFLCPNATNKEDTYLRMYQRDMNTFINSEYYGFFIDGNRQVFNTLIENNPTCSIPQFDSINLLWGNTTIGYFDSSVQVSGGGYQVWLDTSKILNEYENNVRYVRYALRLPIYAENNGKYDTDTYPSGQLYLYIEYDRYDGEYKFGESYVVLYNGITKYLAPLNDSEIIFESVINPYNLRYNNIHTLC